MDPFGDLAESCGPLLIRLHTNGLY